MIYVIEWHNARGEEIFDAKQMIESEFEEEYDRTLVIRNGWIQREDSFVAYGATKDDVCRYFVGGLLTLFNGKREFYL